MNVIGYDALSLVRGADTGTWTSPDVVPEFLIEGIVPSWKADTPGKSLVNIGVSVRVNGEWSNYFDLGHWNSKHELLRRSAGKQKSSVGSVSSDTYFAGEAAPDAFRVRLTLVADGNNVPVVDRANVVAWTEGVDRFSTVSPTTMTKTIKLEVPRYSQYTHRDEFPAYDEGGQSWCSPSSVAMVLRYLGKGPTQEEIESIPPDPKFDEHGRKDPEVVATVFGVADARDHTTGNWAFNTAYASRYGVDASVQQFGSLRDIEGWIKLGVPIIVSLDWNNDPREDPPAPKPLTGAHPLKSGGHLLVVTGFTKNGDVIVNDPAQKNGDEFSNEHISVTYNRAEFERRWLEATGGIVYVIKPIGLESLLADTSFSL